MSANQPTREKILKAAFEIIAEEGIQDVTILKLSQRAQVNIAAVNYHFKGKTQLLDLVIDFMFARMKHLFDSLRDERFSGRDRIEKFLDRYTGILMKIPGAVKSIAYLIANRKNIPESFYRNGQTVIGLVADCIRHEQSNGSSCFQADTDDIIRMKSVQLIFSCLHPAWLTDFGRELTGYDMHDPHTRKTYIRLLVDRTFGRKNDGSENGGN